MEDKMQSGIDRRSVLKGAAAAAGVSLFNINHSWSKDVLWDGHPFDAGGADVATWRSGVGSGRSRSGNSCCSDFEKDFNCKIAWDSAFPWFPKFAAGGPEGSVPTTLANWNLARTCIKTARAGDYYPSPRRRAAKHSQTPTNLWDFAKVDRTRNHLGLRALYLRLPHRFGRRADQVVHGFLACASLVGKRATYVTVNELQMTFFLTACAVFGKDRVRHRRQATPR